MVQHKSVFDMCNEILTELHRLRHFSHEIIDSFSEETSFYERLISKCIPMNHVEIAKFVVKKVDKILRLKRDVILEKRSLDELSDASRAALEFEKQYNFMMMQTVDDITDVLMCRLLVDTADYFQNAYFVNVLSD